jgi:hypothetical protein
VNFRREQVGPLRFTERHQGCGDHPEEGKNGNQDTDGKENVGGDILQDDPDRFTMTV